MMKLLHQQSIQVHLFQIPDRMWYSVGATYKFTPNLSIDGFVHLRGKKFTLPKANQLGLKGQ